MIHEIRFRLEESESTNAVIQFWHVDEDDEVEEGDILVDIETEDESGFTLHSPITGVVKQIFLEEGEIVEEGDLIAIIEEMEEE